MKRSRKKAFIAAIIASAAIGAALAVLAASRAKPVLQIARLFCEVKPWGDQTLYPGQQSYAWITNNEALVNTNPAGNAPSNLVRVALGPDGNAGPPTRSAFSPLRDFLVSPNGKFAASIAYETGPTIRKGNVPVRTMKTYMSICGIDGKALMRRALTVPEDPHSEEMDRWAWAPDSGSLCYLQTTPKVCIWRVTVPGGKFEELAVPPDFRLPSTGRPTDAVENRILGFTGANSVLIAEPYLQSHAFYKPFGPASPQPDINSPRATLVELSLEGKPKVVRTYSPVAPPSTGIGMIALSPAGDRLFWGALCAKVPTPLESRLHRFLRFVPGEATVVERGWVSRLDGSGMKEIGYYEIPGSPSSPNYNLQPWILEPRWTPDGRRISFVFKDRIMTIPAD